MWLLVLLNQLLLREWFFSVFRAALTAEVSAKGKVIPEQKSSHKKQEKEYGMLISRDQMRTSPRGHERLRDFAHKNRSP